MGYFSNGTEGLDYQEQWCRRCANDDRKTSGATGCAVWDAHLIHNSAGANDNEHVLHMLIPLSEDGLWNERCRMFRVREDS